MNGRLVSFLGMVTILVLTFSILLRFQVVKAEPGTIYIRANGLVEGSDKIVTVDNVTYTFIDNITDSIVIERSNIIINGNRYTLQGSGSGTAFYSDIDNVTVRSIDIRDFEEGIRLGASLNTVSGNTITNCETGVRLDSGDNNTVSENTITNSSTGVHLQWSSNNNTFFGNTIINSTFGVLLSEGSNNNTVFGNTITNSNRGVYLRSSNNTVSGNTVANSYDCVVVDSSDNWIYHNNFINYTRPADTSASARWDDGYPSGGNYWSDYLARYPNAAENDSSAIWDTSYVINVNNIDRYPLMGMFCDFKATAEYHVQTICNSSISDFQFNGTAIMFNVTGVEGTAGFCRICIPTSLVNAPYKVFVNETEVTSNLLPFSNSTHSYLYFNYTHSTQEVIIIPEFPLSPVLPLFMMATLLATIVCRRKRMRFNRG
jgi:parallel beta-helix repeat protein